MRIHIVLVTVVLAVGGCTGASASRDLVTVAITEPQHLIPSGTSDPGGSQVLAALFTPLVGYDDRNQPSEVAAESVTTTDNVTWTIKLKDGYTFHNGEQVTAGSYLDAWNYAAYGPNGQENNYFFERFDGYAALNPAEGKPKTRRLAGLKKVDDLAFTVKLSAPFGGFRAMLGSTPFYPLPKAAFGVRRRAEGGLRTGAGR